MLLKQYISNSSDARMQASSEDVTDLITTMAEKAKIVFGLCDSEGKGFITKRDMLRLKDELPLSSEQLEVVFNDLDTDKNGYLTLQEFANGFGQFLGLSPSATNGLDFLESNVTADASDVLSQSLKTLIENFDACGRHDDIIAIKSLWLRLSREQPEVLSNFEDFVLRIVSMLQNKQMDYKALQTSMANNRTIHNKELHMLYDEMEAQIMGEKKKICMEEMDREKILRKNLEFELNDKERRLEELIIQQKEMELKMKEMRLDTIDVQQRNDLLMEEKKLIEKEFSESKQDLEETRATISKIKGFNIHDKMFQQQISLEISEWISLERKNLLRQVQDLEGRNKLLMDRYDEYEEKMASSRRCDQINHNDQPLHMLRNFSIDEAMMPKDIEIISSSSEDEDTKPAVNFDGGGRVYKVVFVGDSAVGKSTFIHRVCSKSFNASLSATIGIDFQICNVRVDAQVVILQLWDTAGQERYKSFSRQYFRKADGVIAMYDITDIGSFLHVRYWLDDIKDSVEDSTILMLLGTKQDLVQKDNITSVVYPGEARKLAYEYGASFFETSAKTGFNIEECIVYLARVLRDKEDENIAKSLTINSNEILHKKLCCT